MKFIRQTVICDASVIGDVCADLLPCAWAIEAGRSPPHWHDPGRLLQGRSHRNGLAVSFSSGVVLNLNLGTSLIDLVSSPAPWLSPMFGLALHELIINAVVHGNLRVASGNSATWSDLSARQSAILQAMADPARAGLMVTVALAWSDDGLEATVADEGDGYDPSTVRRAINASGRGLQLARMVGQVETLRGGRQATITVGQRAERSPKPGGAQTCG